MTAGDGPPVVLAHGAMSDHRVWEDQIRLLSPDYSVVAWDSPGGGRSDDPPAEFSMADYARGLAAVIDHAGTGRPTSSAIRSEAAWHWLSTPSDPTVCSA